MSIKENLEKVKQKIADAAISVGKKPEDITLVMATKTVDPERIREAVRSGGHIIAENKIQEALRKYEVLTWIKMSIERPSLMRRLSSFSTRLIRSTE